MKNAFDNKKIKICKIRKIDIRFYNILLFIANAISWLGIFAMSMNGLSQSISPKLSVK